jgi:hypothetical protein
MQSEPHEPTLQLLADMAALFADGPKLEREIKRLTDARAAAEKAQAKLTDARARHEQFIAETTATLDAQRSKQAIHELDLQRREGLLEASEERQKRTEEILKTRFGITQVAGASGLVREYVDTRPEAADPHYGANQ